MRATVALVLVLMLLTTPAGAYHTSTQRITDDTAYTLNPNVYRIGLFKLQYGFFDSVTGGTVWPLWFVKVANLHGKWRVWERGQWAAAAQLGVYRLDLSDLENTDPSAGTAVIVGAPFELTGSYRFGDRFSLSLASVYTRVRVDGEVENNDLRGAVDNFQLASTVEWRIGRVTAFLLHGRYLVFQRLSGGGDMTLHPDDFTTVELHLGASSGVLDFPFAASVTGSFLFSWAKWNLRLGAGYGHWSLPIVNFVLPRTVVYPEFDLYRFF